MGQTNSRLYPDQPIIIDDPNNFNLSVSEETVIGTKDIEFGDPKLNNFEVTKKKIEKTYQKN